MFAPCYTNPWGQEESLEIAEFKTRLKNMHTLA